MKFSLESRPSSVGSGDLLVLPVLDEKPFAHAAINALLKKLGQVPLKLLKKEEFKGEAGDSRMFATHGKLPFDYVLFMGLGSAKKASLENLRKAASKSAQAAERIKAKKMVSLLPLALDKKIPAQDAGQAYAEGVLLGLYRFEKYKSKKEKAGPLQEVRYLLGDAKSAKPFQAGLKAGELISQGVNYARDLINTPARDKPPEFLGREAKKIRGLRTKVFHHRQLQRLGMGALYGVGMGSPNPPVFVEMHYRPRGRVKKRIAIVGKGITFDSGGLSLKPAKSMETMKDDMSGAATILAVMRLLPALKLPVEVYGYIASAENMPDGGAQRPGDVVKAYNGKTIEVLNTDAEGRLALADALSYLTKHRKVDYIIDVATLTGAALVALGDLYTAALGTDAELIRKLKDCGEECGEKVWELPLAEEYAEEMKSQVADIQNIGGPYGGTINGALFLKNFVAEKAKWVHLDIAGPSWANKPWAYAPKGGTGIMVRTFLRLFSKF
ncbi:MAG: leucyl aminopeptidase [bacterium]